MRRAIWITAWITAALLGCGDGGSGQPDSGTNSCPILEQPTFELGTGADRFEAMTDGQRLRMAPGLQGGCHFWLAVRTKGFAPRRFTIEYDLVDAVTGASTGDASGQGVLLQPGDEGCEYVGYAAAIRSPPDLVGKMIRIDVRVIDDLGRSARASRTVLADWPEANAELCGAR